MPGRGWVPAWRWRRRSGRRASRSSAARPSPPGWPGAIHGRALAHAPACRENNQGGSGKLQPPIGDSNLFLIIQGIPRSSGPRERAPWPLRTAEWQRRQPFRAALPACTDDFTRHWSQMRGPPPDFLGGRVTTRQADVRPIQCRKCRIPVNTMARPEPVGRGNHFLVVHRCRRAESPPSRRPAPPPPGRPGTERTRPRRPRSPPAAARPSWRQTGPHPRGSSAPRRCPRVWPSRA